MPVGIPAWQAWTPTLLSATAARRRRGWWWSGRRASGCAGGCAGPRAGSGGGAGILALVTLRAAGADRSGARATGAGSAGPLVDRLANGIFQASQHLAKDHTLIPGQGRQGRVGQDLDGFPRMQADDPGSYLEMPDIHQAFFQGNEGGAVVLHLDIEDGAAHRNQRGGRGDIIRIRNAGEMLDIDFDLAHPDIQEVGDAVGLAERDFGVGEDLKRAAVRRLKLGVPIGAGFDHVLLVDDAAGWNDDAVEAHFGGGEAI